MNVGLPPMRRPSSPRRSATVVTNLRLNRSESKRQAQSRLRDAGGHVMKMIEAAKMPQMRHAKILPQPQAESACRGHHEPMSGPPAELRTFRPGLDLLHKAHQRGGHRHPGRTPGKLLDPVLVEASSQAEVRIINVLVSHLALLAVKVRAVCRWELVEGLFYAQPH